MVSIGGVISKEHCSVQPYAQIGGCQVYTALSSAWNHASPKQAGGRCMWKEVVKLLPYVCFINIHMLNTFIKAVISSKCKGLSSPSWGIAVAYIGVRSWKLAQKSGKHIMPDSPWRIILLPAYLALGFRHSINLEPGSHHSPAHLVSCSKQTQCNYLSQIAAWPLREVGGGREEKQKPPAEPQFLLCSSQPYTGWNYALGWIMSRSNHCHLHSVTALSKEEEEDPSLIFQKKCCHLLFH